MTIRLRERYVLTVMICLLIGWNYWASFFFWYAPFSSSGGLSVDFRAFYSAGRLWLSQVNPYVINGRASGFVYPPTSLPFFAVFALFDFTFASQLWWVSYFSLFVVALLALALTLKDARRYVFVSIAVLLLLTSHPLFWLFYLGQIDLLIAGFAILSLVCERLKHPIASAVLLSIATLLKGPAVLLLIYFVVFRRDLRYLAHYLVSTLLIVWVSLLVVPIGLYSYYALNVLPSLPFTSGLDLNQPIMGVVSLPITLVVFVAGCVVFAFFSFWASSNKLASGHRVLCVDAMFLMNILVMLLLGLTSAIYPYVWVILPLALFLSTLLMEEVKREYLALVGFATCLLNSMLSPNFLYYPIQFPLEVIGNLIMILGLMLIYLRPTLVASGKVAIKQPGDNPLPQL